MSLVRIGAHLVVICLVELGRFVVPPEPIVVLLLGHLNVDKKERLVNGNGDEV